MTGEDWDKTEGSFTRNVRRTRFEDKLEYKTTASQYTSWRVTLHTVTGGNAPTENVSEGAFPSLK
jgi:hypothetical protein